MKKHMALVTLIVVLCGCAIVAFKFMGDSSFKMPEKYKIAIAFTTGRRVAAERAKVCFYDKNGDLLKQEKYKATLCDNCISFEPETGDYNLFTHENVYFSNGRSIHNDEMDSIYKFASYKGWDDVYESGYMKKWKMFYKHIPHGLSYEHKELGYFDILTLYNEHEINNIRVKKSGIMVSDDNETAIYNLVENGNRIAYEKISRKNSKFFIKEGNIDIKGFEKTEGGYYLINAVWSDNNLYVLMGTGEGENTDKYILCFEKNGDDIEYKYSSFVNFESMNISSNCLTSDTVAVDTGKTIEYYTESFVLGMISYDKNEHTFEFYPYFQSDKRDIEDITCEVKVIENKVFILIADYNANSYTIYQKTQSSELEKITEIDKSEDLFLADFYVK